MKIKSFLWLLAFIPILAFGQNRFSDLKPKPWAELAPQISPDPSRNQEPAFAIRINDRLREAWYDDERDSITLRIPFLNAITFHRVQIHDPLFTVKTSYPETLKKKQVEGIHYQTRSGVGGLSIFYNDLMAVFVQNGKTWNICQSNKEPDLYYVSAMEDYDPGWQCHTEDQDFPTSNRGAANAASSVSCKVVKIGFEADFSLLQARGSVTAVSNYVSGIFNVVNQLYRNEGIAISFGSLFVWTQPDPYVGLANANTVLFNFATNRPVSAMTDNLLHFVSVRANLGGMAYTGVLCNASVKHGVSFIYNSYSFFPAYSWSVNVVAHELGHNFGSRHTHWCGWTLPNGTTGRIDSCAAGEGTCGSTTKFGTRGTIMSYCHVTGSIDFNLGFGPLPGNVMRTNLNNANCIATGTGPECDSLQPQPPVVQQCTENLQHYVNAQGQSCFRFRIRPGCRYTVNYCRYDGFTQGNQPQPAAVPSACGVRNSLNNYLPTAAELTSGWVDRVANPQPSFRQRWYTVQVVSGSQRMITFFWWP